MTTPNEEHLGILNQGVAAWNKWRKENPKITPNLQKTDLQRADLADANLRGANLRGTNVTQEQLDQACGNVETKLPNGLTISECPD